MPKAEFKLSRQRSTKSAITVNGLLTWRARRLRSLRLEPDSRDRHLAYIAAIDRVLVNVLGFTGDMAEASRDFRREALFGRGELQRAVATVLRQANEPLTTRQITARVMATKGRTLEPGRLSKEWINRVRKVCQRLPVEAVTLDGVAAWGKCRK